MKSKSFGRSDPSLEHRVIQPEPNMGHHGEKNEVCHMHLPRIKSLPFKWKHHMNNEYELWINQAAAADPNLLKTQDSRLEERNLYTAVYSQ